MTNDSTFWSHEKHPALPLSSKNVSSPSSPCLEWQQRGSWVKASLSRRRCSTSWMSSPSSHHRRSYPGKIDSDCKQISKPWREIIFTQNLDEGIAPFCNKHQLLVITRPELVAHRFKEAVFFSSGSDQLKKNTWSTFYLGIHLFSSGWRN